MAEKTVFHNVPVRTQVLEGACWYTAFEMVVAYERSRNRGQGLTDPGDNEYSRTLFLENKGLGANGPAERENVAADLGFVCDYMSATADGMLGLLALAPVIYAGRWAHKPSGHWVVLVGLSENTLVINDPWLTERQTMDYDQFMGRHLRQTAERPLIHPP